MHQYVVPPLRTGSVNVFLPHSLTSSVRGEDEGYLSCRRVVGPRLWQAEVIRGATLVTKEVTPSQSSHKSSGERFLQPLVSSFFKFTVK